PQGVYSPQNSTCAKTMKTKISRRSALSKMAAGAAAVSAAPGLAERLTAAESAAGASLKGRINHSVCKWCYPNVELEDLCVAGKAMGLQSIELLEPKDWPTLLKHRPHVRHGQRRGRDHLRIQSPGPSRRPHQEI